MKVVWYEPAKTGAQKILAAKLQAEKIIFLENQQLEGWEVDIFLPRYYLVVEVDGFYHLSSKQQERDLEKDSRLRAAGYHVLRFTNAQIYQDGSRCVQEIKDIITKHNRKLKEVKKIDRPKMQWQKRLKELKEQLTNEEKKDHGSHRGR